MTGPDAILAVVDALAELNIPYMMVGSFAANQYAIIRSTDDADFVVELATGPSTTWRSVWAPPSGSTRK